MSEVKAILSLKYFFVTKYNKGILINPQNSAGRRTESFDRGTILKSKNDTK
jgi:hypothetical protein